MSKNKFLGCTHGYFKNLTFALHYQFLSGFYKKPGFIFWNSKQP